MIICRPPDPPLRTTAGSSPPTHGRPRGTAGRSEPPARTGTPGQRPAGRAMNWERHHIEVVATAAADQPTRAADLLRGHVASVGCDPLAIRITARLQPPTGPGDRLKDLAGQLPGCHASPWPSGPMTP
jgi:hypothetical protein